MHLPLPYRIQSDALAGAASVYILILYGFVWITGNGFEPAAPLVSEAVFGHLKAVTLFMPDGAFRLAFTNGLMSESMALWFGSMQLWLGRQRERCEKS